MEDMFHACIPLLSATVGTTCSVCYVIWDFAPCIKCLRLKVEEEDRPKCFALGRLQAHGALVLD